MDDEPGAVVWTSGTSGTSGTSESCIWYDEEQIDWNLV